MVHFVDTWRLTRCYILDRYSFILWYYLPRCYFGLHWWCYKVARNWPAQHKNIRKVLRENIVGLMVFLLKLYNVYRLSQAGWDGLVVEKGAWIASESCLMVLLHVMWPAKVRITRGSPTSSASPIIHRLPVWTSRVLAWGIQVSAMLHIELMLKNAMFNIFWGEGLLY